MSEDIEALRKDAMRYRWVRDYAYGEHAPIVEAPGDMWDAYIDEAMSEQQAEPAERE